MKTEKTFKKGDRVNLLQNWDRKGTVNIVPAIVHSCGNKKMTLRTEDGRMLGRDFIPNVLQLRPEYFDMYYRKGVYNEVLPEAVDAEARAIEFAKEIIAEETERINGSIEKNRYDTGYVRSMEKSLAEIHEPRVTVNP